MELFGSYTSPFVRHCRIVLAQSKLEYRFTETAATSLENKSPTKKVPFLLDGELGFSDSSSIVRYVREKAGQEFLPDTRDFDLFCLVNTLLDSAANAFLFERVDGLLPANSKYLTRQVDRVESGLTELEQRELTGDVPGNDALIRLACFLAWGRFRQRFSLEARPRLAALLNAYDEWPVFAETAPPEGA